jgi:hypothetical protein
VIYYERRGDLNELEEMEREAIPEGWERDLEQKQLERRRNQAYE